MLEVAELRGARDQLKEQLRLANTAALEADASQKRRADQLARAVAAVSEMNGLLSEAVLDRSRLMGQQVILEQKLADLGQDLDRARGREKQLLQTSAELERMSREVARQSERIRSLSAEMEQLERTLTHERQQSRTLLEQCRGLWEEREFLLWALFQTLSETPERPTSGPVTSDLAEK